MSNVLQFPMNNSHVIDFVKILKENNRDTNEFITLLKGIADLEVMLKQSNENIALMQNNRKIKKLYK